MKKMILSFLFVLLFFPVAASANLSISAFHVLFEASSPRRAEVVRVSNTSHSAKTYRIKLINFKQLPDGSYQPLEKPLPGNPFASPYISFSPHETTLLPGQSQTIRLVRKAMAAASDGEYVSHLLVQEMPGKTPSPVTGGNDALKIDIRALYGITIPVIIDKGDLTSSGSIVQASLNHSAAKPMAEVVVKRSGNRSFWGNLIIKENNKEIGRINAFKIFMTTPQRRINIPLAKNPSGKVSVILQDARTDAVISSRNI